MESAAAEAGERSRSAPMSTATEEAAASAVPASSRKGLNSAGGVFAALSRLFFRAPKLAAVFPAPSIPHKSADSR